MSSYVYSSLSAPGSVDIVVPTGGFDPFNLAGTNNVTNNIYVLFDVDAIAVAAGDFSSLPNCYAAKCLLAFRPSDQSAVLISTTVDTSFGVDIHWSPGIASGGKFKLTATIGESSTHTFSIIVRAIVRLWLDNTGFGGAAQLYSLLV